MNRLGAFLSLAGLSLLGGCGMMGMMGGMHGASGMHGSAAGHGHELAPMVQAQAESGDLAIVLSFPAPRAAAVAPVVVVLRTAGEATDPEDAEVWLRVRTPDGNIDEVRMRSAPASAPGTYQAEYRFATAGPYAVTAEARAGGGPVARQVSVTTDVHLGAEVAARRQPWLTPATVLTGIAVGAMMILMMVRGIP